MQSEIQKWCKNDLFTFIIFLKTKFSAMFLDWIKHSTNVRLFSPAFLDIYMGIGESININLSAEGNTTLKSVDTGIQIEYPGLG